MSEPNKIMESEVEALLESRIRGLDAESDLTFAQIGFLEKCFLGNPNIDPDLIARTLYDLCVRIDAISADDQRLGKLFFRYLPQADEAKQPLLAVRYHGLCNAQGNAYSLLMGMLTKLFKELNERAAYRVPKKGGQ